MSDAREMAGYLAARTHWTHFALAEVPIGDLRALLAERTKIEADNAELVALALKLEGERHAAVLDSSRWQERAELAEALLREIITCHDSIAFDLVGPALIERARKSLPPPPEPTP